MLKILTFFIFSAFSLATLAGDDSYCTDWTKQYGKTCLFASASAERYLRQCENPCTEHITTRCDKEELCHFQNPNTFESDCSDWSKDGNAVCFDTLSQSWEQRWVRACTVGLKEEWCSREKPF